MSVGSLKLVDLETATVCGHHVELVSLDGPTEVVDICSLQGGAYRGPTGATRGYTGVIGISKSYRGYTGV